MRNNINKKRKVKMLAKSVAPVTVKSMWYFEGFADTPETPHDICLARSYETNADFMSGLAGMFDTEEELIEARKRLALSNVNAQGADGTKAAPHVTLASAIRVLLNN